MKSFLCLNDLVIEQPALMGMCVCVVYSVSVPISAEPFPSHSKSITMKRPKIGPGGVQRANPWECVHVCAAFVCLYVCVRAHTDL